MQSEALKELLEQYRDAKLHDIDGEFPVPVGKICERLGIEAFYVKLPDNISGNLYKEGGKYYIKANEGHHPYRRRFTVAHELGHYLKHKEYLDSKKEILERSDTIYTESERQMEAEANRFAAELLMPTKVFIQKYLKSNDLQELADYFFTSKDAIKFRLINLGYRIGC